MDANRAIVRPGNGSPSATIVVVVIGADAMGAIALTAKKLWGDAPKSPPQECCYVAVVHSQKVR